MLNAQWSPQQISARLTVDYPDDPEMRVSHETIYRSLFVQARGALRKELTACLRSGRTRRRPHGRKDPGGYIKDMSSSRIDRLRLKTVRCLVIGKAI